MRDIAARISMVGHKAYKRAVNEYGQNFADYVIKQEAQLHIDNFNEFDRYAEDFPELLEELQEDN